MPCGIKTKLRIFFFLYLFDGHRRVSCSVTHASKPIIQHDEYFKKLPLNFVFFFFFLYAYYKCIYVHIALGVTARCGTFKITLQPLRKLLYILPRRRDTMSRQQITTISHHEKQKIYKYQRMFKKMREIFFSFFQIFHRVYNRVWHRAY